MDNIRVMITVDKAALEKVRPLLAREGMSLSSFSRKVMFDYIEAHENRHNVLTIKEVEALR